MNAFLRVLKKRVDGYHELASLFQIVSLYDSVVVSHKPAGSHDRSSLECDDLSVPTNNSNLALRAAELFEERSGISCPVDISLRKQVPTGGGLGGGNGNAASVFFALNVLSGYPASNTQLLVRLTGLSLSSPCLVEDKINQRHCHARRAGPVNLAPTPPCFSLMVLRTALAAARS